MSLLNFHFRSTSKIVPTSGYVYSFGEEKQIYKSMKERFKDVTECANTAITTDNKIVKIEFDEMNRGKITKVLENKFRLVKLISMGNRIYGFDRKGYLYSMGYLGGVSIPDTKKITDYRTKYYDIGPEESLLTTVDFKGNIRQIFADGRKAPPITYTLRRSRQIKSIVADVGSVLILTNNGDVLRYSEKYKDFETIKQGVEVITYYSKDKFREALFYATKDKVYSNFVEYPIKDVIYGGQSYCLTKQGDLYYLSISRSFKLVKRGLIDVTLGKCGLLISERSIEDVKEIPVPRRMRIDKA